MTTFLKTSKFAKNTRLRVLYSTLFSVFGNVVKHGLSFSIYDITNSIMDPDYHRILELISYFLPIISF